LARLLNHYPEAGHNGVTISKLAEDWYNLLVEEDVTSGQFAHGVRHAVKHCRFFPKLADILVGVKTYREKTPPQPKADPNVKMIEEYTANADNLLPEEIERNRKMIKMIAKAATRQVTIEEAVEYVEAALAEGKNFTITENVCK